MPTGYSAIVDEGGSFVEYALGCARAFGACIDLRDEPRDTPIPDEFVPSDYHLKRQQEAEDELRHVRDLTDEEADEAARKEYEHDIAFDREAASRVSLTFARYDSMRRQVEAWVPPTEEHEGMKKFMLEQLETGRPYEYTPSKIVQRSGEDWRRDQIEHALKNIAYHAEGYAKEVERANSRTRWVRALRQSLAGLK